MRPADLREPAQLALARVETVQAENFAEEPGVRRLYFGLWPRE